MKDKQGSDMSPVLIKQGDKDSLAREWHSLQSCESHYFRQAKAWLVDDNVLVLDYVEGESLLSLDSEQAALFLYLLPQIVRAISVLHQQGWIHGDIKPSNVLFDKRYLKITLIDFGAALPINTMISSQSSIQLTPGFSPESRSYQNHKVTEKDDWYALWQWVLQLKKQSEQGVLTQRESKQLARWLMWLEMKGC
ncbi:hypothetical protein A3K86_02645 [Photobacterium jeanii]|uniref:Protein kinase domain-containing protein n=2 Tax=Photobacterium jeanii TaxID=858640 RepID=A0A178KL38_9GAMM|nr:hypothetical protein A3K86_02645 [Photobacterium jeanii]